MHAQVDVNTPFHIHFAWWEERGRNLGRFLAEILGRSDADLDSGGPLDFIDPQTAEVHELDPLWVEVLTSRAFQPSYITPSTPMTSAVLRALVENLNRPMSSIELHRRINRSNPQTILRVLKTARTEYGIVPIVVERPSASDSKPAAKSRSKTKA